MFQMYARAVSTSVRRLHFNQSIEKHGFLTQFQRNQSSSTSTDPNENKYKSQFSISGEVLDGRPLYIDAQATTPLVSTQCKLILMRNRFVL